MTAIGPFSQLLTFEALPEQGPIQEGQLQIKEDYGVIVQDGLIHKMGPFSKLAQEADETMHLSSPTVAIPGLIDCHTHICFAGSRAGDYSKRLNGATYQAIAAAGGGIMDTVQKTRAAPQEELEQGLRERANQLLRQGVTTCEVKSGYGLTLDDEIKMLRAIAHTKQSGPIDLISTCLAAHVRPPEFSSNQAYLQFILDEILPAAKSENLTKRVDIFVEEHAFTIEEARWFLEKARSLGFDLAIHADQFSRGGALLASEVHALSADHLEQSTPEDAAALARSGVTATVLPGATLGLGMPFPPARMLLDQGASLAIASDWNPGSAPMGDLVMQAAVLGAQQKLNMAETLSALTYRAARALGLKDRGRIITGLRADIAIFPTNDYRDLLYRQGAMRPNVVVSKGQIHKF